MHTKANSERGSLRLTLFLILAMGGCLWTGGQGVFTAMKNRQPTTVACKDLAKGKPTAHWLVLTGCELHVANSAYLIRRSKYEAEGTGRITEAYIPIQASGDASGSRCYAVLATKEPQVLSLLEEMRQAKSDTAAIAFIERHGKELLVKREVSGLVRFGVEEQNGEHAKLAGLRGNLAPDYIILADGDKPHLNTSLGLLTLGVIIGGGLLFMFKSTKEPQTTG